MNYLCLFSKMVKTFVARNNVDLNLISKNLQVSFPLIYISLLNYTTSLLEHLHPIFPIDTKLLQSHGNSL